MGRDFTIEGGRRAVDFLLEEHVTSVMVNGRAMLAFPRPVEIHPNSFLKTLLEAGVPVSYGFSHKGQRRTLADLVDGARLLLRPQELAGRPNEMPWSIIALTHTTSPLRARWTNAWDEPVDLDAVVGSALEALERASAPVSQAMREGRPLAARAPVHHLTCGGTHLIYSVIVAANAGYALNGRASRVRQQVDVLVWRLGADIDLIDRFYAERGQATPLSSWQLLDAKLKLLGHAEECLAFGTQRKVVALSAPQAGEASEGRVRASASPGRREDAGARRGAPYGLRTLSPDRRRRMSRTTRTDPRVKRWGRPKTLVWWLVAGPVALLASGLGGGTGSAQGTGAAEAPAVSPVEDDALVLRQRVAEYWAARIAKDYRTQWELSEPRLKGRMTAEEYGAGKGAIHYLGYEVGAAKIDGTFASVGVKVIARITLPRRPTEPLVRTGTVEDGWVKVAGVWYRRVDQPEPPPPASGRP